MKEKAIKKRKKIDLAQIESGERIINVESSVDYLVLALFRSDNEIKEAGQLRWDLRFLFSKPGIESNLEIRVVNGAARHIDLRVSVEVEKGAKNVSSQLEMRALLLSPDSSVQFVPILEINEIDVSTDHRSTIGTINEEWLNYMKSRGLEKSDAVNLIVEGFLTQ